MLAARGWPATAPYRDARWFAGPLWMLGTIGLWFVPMMLVTAAGGEFLQYRNEILFHQTVTRYAEAWHHHEPFWYYPVKVIPVLWLPLIALIPWLWPRWRTAWRNHDTFVAVLLAWVVIVVLFFSMSSGKRGVYVLPALPALAMAAAPWLPELLRALQPRRVALVLASLLTAGALFGAVYFAVDAQATANIVEQYDAAPALPLGIVGVAGAIALVVFRLRDAWLAVAATLAAVMATVGLVVYPRIDDTRSGRAFMHRR